MRRRIGSLFKNHSGGCTGMGGDAACDCLWKGKYRHREVTLAIWLKEMVDSRSERAGEKALALLVSAIDEGRFTPKGFVTVSTETNFAGFIDTFITRHHEKHEHTSNATRDMLGVVKAGRLGKLKLQELAEDCTTIEDWLDEEGEGRKWSASTWNNYRGLLNVVFKKATIWPVKAGKPRIAHNPISQIEARREIEPEHFKNRVLIEDVEDRLFAVVDQLNRVQHGPNTRGVLTQEKADEIRRRCTFGEQQKLVARAFNVSETVVSQIVNGRIWNPEKYTVGTKGTEMERRLIGAFDGGLRAGEMLLIQIKHVDWRTVKIVDKGGKQITCYLIKLPPSMTKGGKTSGKVETIYVATERFRRMLDQRRMQLKNNTEAYIFGTEAGHRQGSFKKLWHALFALAGIEYGRDIGVVWHTIRHEHISRIAELTDDPQVVQELARHRYFETTQLYLKARERKKILAVAGLCRA